MKRIVALICTGILSWLLSPCHAFEVQRTKTTSFRSLSVSGEELSSSVEFSIDPSSMKAKEIMNHLGLSSEQHHQLAKLAVLVVDWNTRINLISRRDCTKEVVFGRHIVPSLAPLGLDTPLIPDQAESFRVVDVGTGGGFPGLPLAIAFPNVDFLLLDSVGKKLSAIEDMAKTLGLENVKIHHGRAEEYTKAKFNLCVGRSVTAIPKYCFWIQDLLDREGNLCYLIGGEIEQDLLDRATQDVNIDDLLSCPGSSDKRVLVFPASQVRRIASASGEKTRTKPKNKLTLGKNKKKAKGEWAKRDNSQPKQRGYENFQRYDSNQ